MSGIALSSRVRLARNYEDIPFRPRMAQKDGQEVISRTLNVLRDMPQTYVYLPMETSDPLVRRALSEKHLISDELHTSELGAVLLRRDERAAVMMNEEDHLRIQGYAEGDDVNAAAEIAFEIEDALERRQRFAFDAQWGYLTACPTNAGTGLRASVSLHLPMLTLLKQMGKVSQLTGKLSLTLRGVYGDGNEARGHVYQLSNQVTLGRAEHEIIDAVAAVTRQIGELENVFRQKALERDPVAFEDQLWRSYGLMRSARRMPLREFMAHWSNLRLGAALDKLPLTTAQCDDMLTRAQPAHLQKDAAREMDEKETDIRRSDLIRALIDGGKQHGDLR